MSQILADNITLTSLYDDKFDCCKTDRDDQDQYFENSGELWDSSQHFVEKKRNDLVLKFEHHTYNYTTKNMFSIEKSGRMKYREVVNYYKKIAQKLDEIKMDRSVLSGMPVIKNTRIPVSLILYCLKDDMSIKEICDTYKLTTEDIERAMDYAIELLDAPFQDDEE